MLRFAALCLLVLFTPRPVAAQPEPIGGDGYALAPYLSGAPASWRDEDEAWYRRNRAFSRGGKVLTVVGVASVLSYAVLARDRLLIAGMGMQITGQLTWAGADLRGANELRRRGVRVPKVAGLVGLAGALLLSPLLWVAGPVQSMQLRDAHARLAGLSSTRAASQIAGFGLALRATY